MHPDDDIQAVQKLSDAYRRITAELGKVIVGQQQVIEELLIAMFARGHCLLVGVPGLAKTLMIRTLADALSLNFSRIQFTPDLMPSDITGTEVIQEDKSTGTRVFRFLPGPIFANVILADEINRTPPKTQAALLEAMQEHQVTVGGKRHKLDEPFFVLATQNPIEQEGTYPLPEAQLDRFMFNILVDYPSEQEEFEIVKRTTADVPITITPTLSGEEIVELTQNRAPRAGGRSCDALCAAVRPALPPRSSRFVEGARFHSRLCQLGRRPAGQPVSGAGRQSPCGVARPLLRHVRRYSRRSGAGAAASHHDEFQCRGRRRQARRHRPPTD